MKKVGRKVVSVLLTLCMLLTMLPVSALAADEGTVDTAPAETNLAEPVNTGNSSSDEGETPVSTLVAGTENSVHYVDEDGRTQTCAEYTTVAADTTTWSNGWYVVTGTVTLDDRVEVSDSVNLILADGAELNATKGIGVTYDNSLTIYGQSGGTGKLTAGAYQVYDSAAIGGTDDRDQNRNLCAHGDITINGGDITATGASAGIGGGESATGTSGTITINGGTVKATGGSDAAGIGGGYANTTNGGAIIINGGDITATGGSKAAGIGAGYSSAGMGITINGGTVNATGGSDDTYGGAGIGAGYSTAPDAALASITITGGDVTAEGGSGAAGIGSGSGTSAAVGAIEISGSAEVHATGGNSGTFAGAGIGAGGQDDCGSITISGGAKVTATGGTGSSYGGAGIGAGGKGPCDSITISDSADVTAVGGAGDLRGGVGIGAGGGINIDDSYQPIPSCNSIEITGGTVDATGGTGAAGIGGNEMSPVEDVSISGGSFTEDTFPGGAIPEDYLAAGYELKRDADGNWSVEKKEETPPAPAGVAQIGEQTYPTLEAAFATVEDNQKTTITLLKDIAVSAPITIGEAKNVIFDMKGHTITAGEGFSTRVFTNNGTLTITGNGTIDVTAAGANGYGAVNNFGTLNVVDGTYKNLKESNASTFYNRNGGTATFENPTIYGGGGCIGTEVNTTTTINGGYYENETYPAVENRGNMTITAGTFKNTSCSSCDGSKWGYTVRSGESSENAYLKIQGTAADSVKVTGVQGGLAVIGGTADIHNGVYETVACDVHTTGASAFYAGYFTGESYETAVTIHDGTFQSVSKTAVLVGNDNPPPDSGAGEASTVMIKGGTFIGGDAAKTAITVENTAYAKGGASISGGTFSSKPSEEFFAEGFKPEQNEDGTWGVVTETTYVAQIGENKYATLSEALNKVQEGETIKLLAPATVNMTETYVITGKAITLDLNGQTVTWNSTAQYVFKVEKGGLTIQDSGAGGALNFVTSYNSTSCKGIYVYTNGKLTVTGGTISSNRGHVIGATGETSAVTMTGGTVKVPSLGSYAYALYLYNGQHSISGVNIAFDAEAAGTSLYGVYASGGATVNLAEVTVDGSAVPDTKSVVCVYGGSNTTPVTISSGTFKANGKGTSYAVGGGSSNNTAISGGTFNGAVKAAIGKVTGGQFSVQPSAAYLPEGKIYELQQDGYYHVVDGTYVARLGTVGYTSWDALWKDASEGTTASAVYILADVEEITVPEGKNVTFYNSGNCTIGKITNNGTCKIISYAMTGTEVVNNGNLNLGHEVKSVVNNQNATMVATSYTYAKVTDSITNSGTMTISKGTYPCTITNTGTITLTGGSFAQEVTHWCKEGYTTQKSGDLWVVVKNGPHVAEINGYWYTSLSAAINAAKDGDTVKLLMNTTLTPTTTGTGLKSAITISGVSKPNLTLDLNGKTISWDQNYADQTLSTTPVMFSISGGANIKITGNGTIDTELGSNTSYGINMTTSTKNQLTIENGTFTGAPTAIQVEKGTLTILDGTFKLAETVAQTKPEQAKYVVNAIDANWRDDSANISIQGGSFCFDPSDNPEGEGSSYVAEGFEAVVNADGSFEIAKVKVAEVGNVQYTSLTEAISNVANGGTITLLCDFVQDDQLTITDKTFTLNMAGKTITLGKISDNGGAILLNGSSNVTITGNGGFTFNDDYADSSGQMIGVDGNATLTIENGNFYAGLVCVRAGESAKVYIKGGEYSAYAKFDGRVWLLNLQDNEGAKFYVSGGTFKNYDPTNSDTESPADNFCTPEYAATPTKDESGNTIYTVVEAEARIGETGYVTLADAIAAAGDNDTITLLADVTEDVVVPAGKNITLDLYGHKITNDSDHTIVNNGTLTITDSSEAKTGTVDNVTHGKGALVNNGTVKLSGGTFERSLEAGTLTGANGNSWYTIVNDGTMIIENGVTVKNKGGFSSMICNSKSGVMGNLTIDGGTFDGGINTVKNDVNSTLTINGGTFTNSAQYVIMNWNKATINDGTFATKDTAYAVLFTSSWQNASTSVGELVITGGTFTTATEEQKLIVDRYDADNIGTASISGGTFSEEPDDTYLVDGYAPEQNEDGNWVVVEEAFVAEIVGGEKYESLIEAVNAAKASGGTVKLLANVENLQAVAGQDYALMIDANQSMTLDLNGYKITAEFTNTEGFNLIMNYGELTITDTSEGQNGSIEVTENGSHDSARTSILYNGYDTGKFTLEAGTLKLTGSANSKKPLYGVYSSGTTVVMNGGAIEVRRLNSYSKYSESWDVYGIYNSNNCQTTVNGGKITVENQGRYNSAYGINNASGTVSIHGTPETPYIEANAFNDGIWYEHTLYGKITLYGGKYNMQNDTATGWIKSDIIIADGYEEQRNGDRTVSIVKSPVAQIGSTKYDTLEEALKEAQSGDTIKLLQNVELTDRVIISKDITLNLNDKTISSTADYAFIVNTGSSFTLENGTLSASQNGVFGLTSSTVTLANDATINAGAAGITATNNLLEQGNATINVYGTIHSQDIAVWSQGPKNTINIDSATITSKYFGVYQNGSFGGTTITIKNSTITDESENGTGIYVSNNGTNAENPDQGFQNLIIENSTITGNTAVEVKFTNVTISGDDTCLTATGTPVDSGMNNNGSVTTGYAFAVTHNGTESSKDAAEGTVTISGGKFTGAVGIQEPSEGETTSATISISGGSFSEEPNKDYLAPYYEASQNTTGDNYWTVDVAEEYEATWTNGETLEAGTLDAMLDAANAAKAGTVALLKDIAASGIHVSAGVTLDLAGHELDATGSEFTAYGKVVDSTEGEGLLKLPAEYYTIQKDNPSLPIYDSTAGGYRLYTYQLTTLRTYEPGTANTVQFWFKLTFTNEEAWELLTTDNENHGITVKSKYQFSGQTASESWFSFNSEFIHWIADQVVSSQYTQDQLGFYLNVTNTNLLGERTMTVTPAVDSVPSVGTESEQMTYSLNLGE
ncbi:hypothetical protein B5G06_11850 [Flavonifractor sp. An52]|uniref:beta strand repeat-containing protein n=1 Tax=Flavonifractor sp. An52 TaxID=1965642 RepID=UPI000B36EDF1|nr:hypothetical protein [Flavonifractor sp. An52]OUN80303.1 hypothetical protein B5G06_11850 [Flavonifractor sp. An52]